MSGESSSAAAWFPKLEPARLPTEFRPRPDDPRLGELIQSWDGDPAALKPGRAVLVGFPQDEGVRRNGGRPGANEAPGEIRRWLYRLTPWDGESDTDLSGLPPLDIGNVRVTGDLEKTQADLGAIIGAILRSRAVPVVLGGGHETAYGHYLGYAAAQCQVGVINLDAHLDIRPCLDGRGHSGSPFRQMMEHRTIPLPGSHYVCLGAQPSCVSRVHWRYAHERGVQVGWCRRVRRSLPRLVRAAHDRLVEGQCHVYVSIDADVARAADVPGVSAPNPEGLRGNQVLACARLAGQLPKVSSLDLVEINPRLDIDGRSARWAALAVWHFLIGLARRNLNSRPRSTT